MSSLEDAVRTEIAKILRPKGHAGRIGDDDLLITSGFLDSMDVVRIVNFLEQRFGVDLSDRGFRLGDFDRISDIVRLCSNFSRKQ